MNKEEIIQCLKAVITYDKGEGVPIVQYDNQFLLDKEDIETLLDYINQLETKQMDIKTDWFRVDRNTEAIQLYSFINDYLTFNEVVELYRLLKYKMDYHVDLKKVDEYMEEYENN